MASVSYIQAVRLGKLVGELEELRGIVNRAYNRDDMPFSLHYNHADALKFAVMYGHTDYVEHLLKTHPHEAFSYHSCCPVLFMAIYNGFTEIVDLLCYYSKLARVAKNDRWYMDCCGCTALENGKIPLQVALELGADDIVLVLLRHGADLMARRRGQDVLRDAVTAALSTDGQFHGRHQSDDDLAVWRCLRHLANIHCDFDSKMRDDLEAIARLNDVDIELRFPVSLTQHCRATIRRQIGAHRMPLRDFGLPASLEDFVNLK